MMQKPRGLFRAYIHLQFVHVEGIHLRSGAATVLHALQHGGALFLAGFLA